MIVRIAALKQMPRRWDDSSRPGLPQSKEGPGRRKPRAIRRLASTLALNSNG